MSHLGNKISSNNYFKSLPFNEWIRFSTIPDNIFKTVFDIIDKPTLRYLVSIEISECGEKFKKTHIYDESKNK